MQAAGRKWGKVAGSFVLAIACAVSAGCLGVKPATGPAARDHQATADPQFRSGGASRYLGETERPAITPEQLLGRVGELLQADRPGTARRYVERYPDVALEALRQSRGAEAAPALVFVAWVHDGQCGMGEGSWSAFLRERGERPGHFAGYESSRQQFTEHTRQRRFEEAVALDLPRQARHPLLVLDAALLQAEALLQLNRAEEAAALLRPAIELGQATQPYQTIRLLLLLSDAERVAGRAQPADLAWHQAVQQSAALLARQPQVMDPCAWTRLARLRPTHLPWPAELTQQLAEYRPTFPVMLPVPPDTALWTAVGHAHLQRHEGQSALLAFKQAETATTEASLRHPLSLAQARALLLLEQKPLAIALLVRLVGEKDETTVAAAKAMLAAIKLQDHSVEQALALLQQAVEQGPRTDWPGRAQAEADLGIAYLSLGMEVAGLRWLHSAQQRFAEQHDVPLLMQCLTNEATYFSHARKEAEAESVRQKLRELERV